MKEILKKLGKIELIALVIGVIFVLLSLTLILVLLLQKKQQKKPLITAPQKEGVKVGVKKTAPVQFSPQSPLRVKPGESFSLEIVPVEKLSSLVYRFEIFFDPENLFFKDINSGDFFENPQVLRKEIDNKKGRIYFSVGIKPQEKIETGEPESKKLMANVFFEAKPLKPGQEALETTVSFGENSLILGANTNLNNFNSFIKPYSVIIENL